MVHQNCSFSNLYRAMLLSLFASQLTAPLVGVTCGFGASHPEWSLVSVQMTQHHNGRKAYTTRRWWRDERPTWPLRAASRVACDEILRGQTVRLSTLTFPATDEPVPSRRQTLCSRERSEAEVSRRLQDYPRERATTYLFRICASHARLPTQVWGSRSKGRVETPSLIRFG